MSRVVLSVVASVMLVGPVTAQEGWKADPKLVAQLSGRRPGINYDEAKVPQYELPDPLKKADGSIVRTAAEWPARRAEILELFRDQVYGRRPGKPEELSFAVVEENANALDGAATLKRVAIRSRQEGRSHEFEVLLFLPNKVAGPVPVFLLINNRPITNTDATREERSPFWPVEEVIARGYGIAAFQNRDLSPDDKQDFTKGVIELFEGKTEGKRPADAVAGLAAWGWGASRVMDYFETDPRIDAKRIAVLGHSRGGKAALWTGAEDERFAIVISNNSGCGGAALSRRKLGETVERINTNFPHWFCDNFKAYNGREEDLPIDQHMLIALIAPRAVCVASASEDLWADPKGEFLAQVHASPVYALFGQPPIEADALPPLDQQLIVGTREYHIRTGEHNLTLADWTHYMNFADSLWGTSTKKQPGE